jgi:ATP-dependent Clp protease, protease subunit
MSKKLLPLLNLANLSLANSKVEDGILARWEKTAVSAEAGPNTINIFDGIGQDFMGEGFTAKRMSAALRSIGADKDVVVAINSPGGDFFEGATIYNLLREHKGHVTVKVSGLAASAASVIAMAGDTIQISQVGFLMIHNAWGMMVGNRHDFAQASEVFATFDASMRDLYAARTGMDKAKVEKLMDGETWLNAQDAVDMGFATEIVEVKTAEGDSSEKKTKALAKRTIEAALAKHGVSRSERNEIFQAIGMRDAAEPVARDADEKDWEALVNLMRS